MAVAAAVWPRRPAAVAASALYTIQDDGKRLTRIAAGAATTPTAGDGRRLAARRGGFGGGGISNLKIARDGRTVFYQEGDGVYTASIGGGGGGGGGAAGGAAVAAAVAAAAAAAGWPRRWRRPAAAEAAAAVARSPSTAKVKVDKPAEWDEMFDDAWRTMKYRFYDPKMHGVDWDAARAKYKPLVEFVGDREELMNVINEMIGELNASHTGASAARQRHGGRGGGGDAPVRRPATSASSSSSTTPPAATRSATSTRTARSTRTGSRSPRATTSSPSTASP